MKPNDVAVANVRQGGSTKWGPCEDDSVNTSQFNPLTLPWELYWCSWGVVASTQTGPSTGARAALQYLHRGSLFQDLEKALDGGFMKGDKVLHSCEGCKQGECTVV